MLSLMKKSTIFEKKKFKKHEEHGLLLFSTGMVFGVALSAYLVGFTLFAVLAGLASLIVFYFIENRKD